MPDDIEREVSSGADVEEGLPPATAPEHDGSTTTDLDAVLGAVDHLKAGVERFHERSQAQETLIQRMQERITELQGDQVRALLSPLFSELASLHADLQEAAAKDYTVLPPERLPKELSFLVDRVETALQLVGLESVGATPGAEFDSRLHAAARRVPTDDPSLDRHLAAVQRQGFIFPGAPKASLYARVTVFSYDPALADDAAAPVPVSPVQTVPTES